MANVTDSPVEATPGEDVAAPDLGQTIKTGAGWTIAARFGGRIVRLLTLFLIAKLLGPNLLGVVGVIYIIDAVGMIVTRLGFSAAIIQRKEAGPDHFDSAMVINACAGTALAVVVAACSGLIGRWLEDPLLGEVLLWYPLVFVARALSYTPQAVLRRKMAFRTFAVMGEFANVAGCIVMLTLAFGGLGVWCVFWGELLRGVLLSGFSIGLAGHRFRPRFRADAVREMIGFSGWATVTAVFYYGLCQVDKLIVRVMLGRTALGLYVFAYRLISQPLEQIAMRLYEVMFPAFSRFRDQPEDVVRVYRKLVCAIALFAFPFLGIAAVLADEFFRVFMGPKWQGAILPFQILCIAGIIRVFVGSSSALIRSRGYIRFEAMAVGVLAVMMGVGVWVGCRWGLPGVAVAVNVVMAAYLGMYLFSQTRKTEAHVRVFVDSILPSMYCTLIALGVCVAVAGVLVSIVDVGDLPRLLIAGAAATVVFLIAINWHPDRIMRSVVWELKRILRVGKTGA